MGLRAGYCSPLSEQLSVQAGRRRREEGGRNAPLWGMASCLLLIRGCSACPRRVRPGGTLPAASPGLPGRRPGTRSEVLNETLGVGQDPAGGRHSPQRLGLFRAAGKAGPRDQNGFCVA